MPYKSEKQKKPKLAEKWDRKYGGKVSKTKRGRKK